MKVSRSREFAAIQKQVWRCVDLRDIHERMMHDHRYSEEERAIADAQLASARRRLAQMKFEYLQTKGRAEFQQEAGR